VEIGDGAHIRNAIIDKHNIIPVNAVITPEIVTGFDLDPDYLVEDGIIVIPKRIVPWFGWVDPAIRRVTK
jgi:ADP-glucose pyrophosphorylase